MSQCIWLQIFLNYILSFLSEDIDKVSFRKYLLGLIYNDKSFCVHRISKNTQEKTMWQLYYFLESTINWKKLFYQLAKLIILIFKALNFYLTVDGTPLKQEYATKRIAKHGHIDISGMKNIPQNEMISIGLTNGKIYIPLDYSIWMSSKVSKPKDYRKKTEMFLSLLKRYLLMQIPVKTIMFDSYFSSKKIIRWLNKNRFTWYTRLKKNRIVYVNGNKSQLKELGLEYEQSLVCKLNNIKGEVKILRFCHQDEEYYICSNNIDLTNEELKAEYLKRWEVEVFHREAKQKLGLEFLMMRSWRKLTNHVGFVCLAYSLLTILKQLSGGSVGEVKFKIVDEILGISSAVDILDQKLAS